MSEAPKRSIALAISQALSQELHDRRAHLDASTNLAEVTVTIKLQAGTTWVRGVVWQEERLCRNTGK